MNLPSHPLTASAAASEIAADILTCKMNINPHQYINPFLGRQWFRGF
jgi:hypothetical protein